MILHCSRNSTSVVYANQIRQIKKRMFSDVQSAISQVPCFVLSRLDYCKARLSGVPLENVTKLRKVPNRAVVYNVSFCFLNSKIITKSSKSCCHVQCFLLLFKL